MDGTEGKPLTLPFFSDIELLPDRVISRESRHSIKEVARLFAFRITPFYASLIDPDNPKCPIRLQAIPSEEELACGGVLDPLGEKNIALTPALFKRYPGRAVFLATGECAMYCRFCNRKRLIGKGFKPERFREETFVYLEQHRDINEIIVSGGDPLTLPPDELEHVLKRLKGMAHVRVVRISSRMPVVRPDRVHEHIPAIERYSPLWFVVHINHPREVTPQFREAVTALRKAGAAVVSQTVLLRQVNDCSHILGCLFNLLVAAGVKPYYLFQLDDVVGAAHFKVRVDTGLAIMKELRQTVSGLCMPHYAVDITGGLGKAFLESGCIKRREGSSLVLANQDGEEGIYRDDGNESMCNSCGICGKQIKKPSA